jgi:hypothetical protein
VGLRSVADSNLSICFFRIRSLSMPDSPILTMFYYQED